MIARSIFFFLLVAAVPVRALELRGRLKPQSGEADFSDYVVWLDDGEKLAAPAAAPAPSVRTMSQIGKQFSPRVLAIRQGDQVIFENLDKVFHNVFSLDKRNPFDLGLYRGKEHFAADLKTKIKDEGAPARSFPVEGKFRIFCNIHPDMVGSVYVFGHGYFAQSDKNGLFTLTVPGPGSYDVMVDGPRLDHPFKIAVEAKKDADLAEIDLKLRPSAKTVEHSKKDGKPYDSDNPYQ